MVLIGIITPETDTHLWNDYCDRLVTVSKLNSETVESVRATSSPDDYLLTIPSGSKPKGKMPPLTKDGYAFRLYDSSEQECYLTLAVRVSSSFRFDNEWYGDYSVASDYFRVKGKLPITYNRSCTDAAEFHLLGKRFGLAADYLLSRIARLGFDQEIYYLRVRLIDCYWNLFKVKEAKNLAEETYHSRPFRNEAALRLARCYRRLQESRPLAWKILQNAACDTEDFYQVDRSCYQLEILKEKIKLCPEFDKNSGLLLSIDCLNSMDQIGSRDFHELFDQMMAFYPVLSSQTEGKQLKFPEIQAPFVSSSISVDQNGKAVIRSVSYRITDSGQYTLNNGLVETKNYLSQWNNQLREFGPLTLLADPPLPKRGDIIRGIEDVRLVNGYITATTREYSYCPWNKIVWGPLDQPEKQVVVRNGNDQICEKNWIPLPDGRIIYSWYPYLIVRVGANNMMELTEQQIATPKIFSKYRGSTGIFRVRGHNLALVHCVNERPGNHRRYTHAVVEFDECYHPIRYSAPFAFQDRYGIEYCLSAQSFDDRNIEVFLSVMDRESWHVRMPAGLLLSLLSREI